MTAHRPPCLGSSGAAVAALALACGGRVGYLPHPDGDANGSGGAGTGLSAVILPALRDDWPALPSEAFDEEDCFSIRVFEAGPPEEPGILWTSLWTYDRGSGFVEGYQTSSTAAPLTHFERWSNQGFLELILYDGNPIARRDFVADAAGNTVRRMLSYPEKGDSLVGSPDELEAYYSYYHEYDAENRLVSTEQVEGSGSSWQQHYTENERGECESIERFGEGDESPSRLETFEHRSGLLVRHVIENLGSDASIGDSRDEITYTYDVEGRWVLKVVERTGAYWDEGFTVRDNAPEFIEERVFAASGICYGEELDLFDTRTNSQIEWNGALVPAVRYRRAMSPGCARLDDALPRAHRTGCTFHYDDDALTRWLRR